jgi:hypothetical protein
MMLCQIYTATLIRAVAETNSAEEQRDCVRAGVRFALSKFERAINGGYDVDGMPVTIKTN